MYFKYSHYCSYDWLGMFNILNILVCGLLGLIIISIFELLPSTALADTVSAKTASVFVVSSCSFTSTSTSSYNATIVNGQTSIIIADPITTTCNDASGYAIYAIGNSGDTYNGDYHTDLIFAINNNYNIKTNGTSGASYWKMKLQDLSGATVANSYDSFQVVPNSFTKVAQYASDITVGSFVPAYQVYIGTNQPAGGYTGKVKYTLVHPSTMVAGTYSIAYSANGGAGTAMAAETGIYNFEPHALPTNAYTAPSGYDFAGWCTVQDQTASGVIQGANPQTVCTGASYAAGDTVTSLATAGDTVTLYAYWQVSPQSSCISSPMISTVAPGINYMQSINSSNKSAVLSNLTLGALYQIKDSRDNQTYCVSKLADGNLWLLDNLALDLSDPAVLSGLNSTNTNSSDTTLNYLKGISTGTVSDKYATSAVSAIWVDSYSDPRIYIVDGKNANTSDSLSDSAKTWKYGFYYNFCAASAGSYCYGAGLSYGSPSGNATEDICPKGWRLPVGGTDGDFDTLYTNSNYNSAVTYRNALHLSLAGYISDGTAVSQGDDGYYWSSIRVYSGNMYNLNIDSSSVTPVDDFGRRYSGFSMRCLVASDD